MNLRHVTPDDWRAFRGRFPGAAAFLTEVALANELSELERWAAQHGEKALNPTERRRLRELREWERSRPASAGKDLG